MFGPPQSVGKPGDMISLCVGGRLFVTRRATLYRLPDSRLYLIATQGASFQNSSSSNSYATPDLHTPSPMSNLISGCSSGFLNTSTSDRTVIGGASVLPSNMSAMLGGTMNLKSASSLIRNRASVAPGLQSSHSLTPNRYDMSSFNLSLPLTPQTPSQAPTQSTGYSPVVYFYDRDPEIFRFVLDYYRTGELHLPSSICGPFVRKELIFWGIDESLIGPCCMPAYMRYDEEKRTKNTLFRDCFEDIDSMQNLVKFSRGWKKWRYRMWLFMDHPSSSLPAKIWASCLLVLMIASVMCYCLSTHDVFRMSARVFDNHWPNFVNHSTTSKIVNHVQSRTNSNISNMTQPHQNHTTDDNILELSDICDPSLALSNPKLRRDCYSEPARGLVLADMTLNCLFTAEFMLKVLLAPDKHKFLSSIVSILDIIILSSYWVYMALFYYYYYHAKTQVSDDIELRNQLSGYLWLMNILSMTQAMRILRIFKISKISRILRVLILTVKKSIPELVLLGFLLMNGMFMFSSLMYIAEYRVNDTFPDIPQSFWWSIITLTAVGYGDMHPKGGAGYFVGSVTAICGCIVTGLAIPIIGNNFNTYYKYMKNQLMEDKYLKALRKDMESTSHPTIKSGIGAAVDKGGLPLPGRKPRLINSRHPIRGKVGEQSLRQKLDSMLYLNTLPLKKYFKSKTAKRKQKVFANNLSESQNIPLLKTSRKSMIETKLVKETCDADGETIKRVAKLKQESFDMEHRPSLFQPQSTDKLLNALSTPHRPSLINPDILVESDEQVTEISNHQPLSSNHIVFETNSAELTEDITKQKERSPVFPEGFARLKLHRNSYQEIDFIPASEIQAKRNTPFSQTDLLNKVEEDRNSFDTFVEKRKNYV